MSTFKEFQTIVMESFANRALNENYSVNFTIAPKKTEKELKFDEAVAYVKTLGPGWRLPTIEELEAISLTDHNFKREIYWSSSETANKKDSWAKSFRDGHSNTYYKAAELYVRAIKD